MSTLFAVEIDPAEFDAPDLPDGAMWRKDLIADAERELMRGRTYRRPRNAVYAVIEWTGKRGVVGRVLDWLDSTPGVTRYAELFEETTVAKESTMSHGSKFNSDLDEWVHEVSLDGGADEEAGDSGYGPYWAGMMRGGKEIADAIEANDHKLTSAQRKKLDGTAGVIMTESTDGFLDVAYFSSKTGLDREWAHVEAELTEDEEGEDE